MTRLLRNLSVIAGLGAALAACGGGGGGDTTAATPPALIDAESVRAAAGESNEAFVSATGQLLAASDETSEPRRLDLASPAVDEAAEPVPLV